MAKITLDDILKRYVSSEWIEHVDDEESYRKNNTVLRNEAKADIIKWIKKEVINERRIMNAVLNWENDNFLIPFSNKVVEEVISNINNNLKGKIND